MGKGVSTSSGPSSGEYSTGHSLHPEATTVPPALAAASKGRPSGSGGSFIKGAPSLAVPACTAPTCPTPRPGQAARPGATARKQRLPLPLALSSIFIPIPAIHCSAAATAAGSTTPTTAAASLVELSNDSATSNTSTTTSRIKETFRMKVEHVKGHVFINQYMVIDSLGKGAHGTVKLCLNTDTMVLVAIKMVTKRRARRASIMRPPPPAPGGYPRSGSGSGIPPGGDRAGGGGNSPSASAQASRGNTPPNSAPLPFSARGRRGSAIAYTQDYHSELLVMQQLDHPNVVHLQVCLHPACDTACSCCAALHLPGCSPDAALISAFATAASGDGLRLRLHLLGLRLTILPYLCTCDTYVYYTGGHPGCILQHAAHGHGVYRWGPRAVARAHARHLPASG